MLRAVCKAQTCSAHRVDIYSQLLLLLLVLLLLPAVCGLHCCQPPALHSVVGPCNRQMWYSRRGEGQKCIKCSSSCYWCHVNTHQQLDVRQCKQQSLVRILCRRQRAVLHGFSERQPTCCKRLQGCATTYSA